MLCRIESDQRQSQVSKSCSRLWLIVFASLTLLACGVDDSALLTTQPGGATNMSFSPPTPVLALRALDPNQLHLIVRINGQEISATRESDEQWAATTMVQPGSTISVEVIWIVQELEVAKATKQVSVSSDGATISFDSSEFNTSMDQDGDGRFNIDEFNAETDPRDSTDPVQVLNDVALALSFELPQALEHASQSSIDSLYVEASVNEEPVTVTRNGNGWLAGASVSAGNSTFVSVAFYTSDLRDTQLAAFQGSESAGSGGAITIAAEAYNTEDFNNNNDGASNAEEFVAASGPEETGNEPDEPDEPGNEPDAATACAISNFEPGCDYDSDNDGIYDSVEGEFENDDRDSLPDYLESNVVDEDEDGFFAHEDTNETDSCAPDKRVEVCLLLSRDTDGDKILDVAEGYLLDPAPDEDGDGEPDWEESIKDDPDGDGVVNQFDKDNDNPCIPKRDNDNCRVHGD
ncbi:MAG: hypothetical protein V3U76_00790 [Granulosicoccus sp.]